MVQGVCYVRVWNLHTSVQVSMPAGGHCGQDVLFSVVCLSPSDWEGLLVNQTAVVLVLELGSAPQTDWAASSVDAGSGPQAAEQTFLTPELSLQTPGFSMTLYTESQTQTNSLYFPRFFALFPKPAGLLCGC